MGHKKRSAYIVSILGFLLIFALASGIWSAMNTYGADYNSGETIYFENKRLSEMGYIINDTPYIPLTTVERYGDTSHIFIDKTAKKICIDLSKQNIIMADDATTNFLKTYGGTVYIPLKTIEDQLYVPLNTMEQFIKLSYSLSSNGIKLFAYSGSEKIAKVNRDHTEGIPSLSVLETPADPFVLSKGEIVFIKGETDNYFKIETQEGFLGYVMKSQITISDLDLSKVDFYAQKKDKFIRGSEKINLVWQYVNTVTPPAPTTKTRGIDILSPTWFDLIVDGNGAVENNGDLGFTHKAHKNGYAVWATITNNMGVKGSTVYTSTVFSNSRLLNKTVAQYIFYACLYDVDGINIDYEQVLDSDRAGLTAFTALLRTYTERQGLNLSIDTLIPKPWTVEYDRRSLAKYVDFVAVMTYDEHYGGYEIDIFG